ncbi:shikimate dehydrogenase [Deinococcus psychrotolerans]|uniref:Shikimate dehydrogenase (NADP(+)) n=1 Tax=Deinococcus psychrotolerans TaxID=2489213 RepID=A0A3G8Y9A5_9DEIO|nr:shikimate dehydrogenase [Deinococcus psychrotolerans]AZI41952.1 shikimate dehydrogenase [Deinococcus psychrotolerans]
MNDAGERKTQNKAMQRAYLFADPVSHTLSPAMHNAAFAACGLVAYYAARHVRPAELGAAVASLRQVDVLGANLTLPHKEAVLPFLDSLSAAARSIGAVNTIINRGGQLHGDNTDAPGFLAALAAAQAGNSDTAAGSAVVLGAGGAARAAVYALRSQGRRVYVINRTLSKAQSLCADLGGEARERQNVPWAEVKLIVNASSAGLGNPQETPLPDFEFSSLPPSALIYDMVYKPAETRLLREARAAGLSTENGLGMLAQQARLAFMAWTNCQPAIEVFLDALSENQPQARVEDSPP